MMGVFVRIVVWMASGWLMSAGLPEDFVAEIMQHPEVLGTIQVGGETLAGLATAVVALGWRQAAIKFGWSR